jgi:hypothetical protein
MYHDGSFHCAQPSSLFAIYLHWQALVTRHLRERSAPGYAYVCEFASLSEKRKPAFILYDLLGNRVDYIAEVISHGGYGGAKCNLRLWFPS